MPKVAIITRTKNRNLLLKRTIETVLAQGFEDWEHVIVNDGGSREALETLFEAYLPAYAGRARFIHNETSVGMDEAVNIGFRNSRSEYVVVLDDDDAWAPNFLEAMIPALAQPRNSGTRGVFCHTVIVKEKIEGDAIVEIGRENFNQWISGINLLELYAWNRFVPVGFLFERAAAEQIGLWDPSVAFCADWEFNIRFLLNFEVGVLAENLAFWHQRPTSVGDEGNSVIHRWDGHLNSRHLLINRWIREAMASGRLSDAEIFGFSCTTELHHVMNHKTDFLAAKLDKLIDAVGRIDARLQRLEEAGRLEP